MPRRPPPNRRVKVLKLDSLGLEYLMAFMSGWRPGKSLANSQRAPWATWREYLTDWRAVRDEVEARQGEFGKPFDHWFAEWVLQHYGLNGPTSTQATRLIRYSPFAGIDKCPRYQVEYWIMTGYFTEVDVSGGGGPFYVDAVTRYALSVVGPQELTDGRIVRLEGDDRPVVPSVDRRVSV